MIKSKTISYYVATNGDDDADGTLEQPFATLVRAQQEVRKLPKAVHADIVVYLREGSYQLDRTFGLTDAAGDSAPDGHTVTYQAYEYATKKPETVVLHGGKPITGWKLHDATKNIWQADIGMLDARQLYVNGQRAERARQVGIPGTVTRTQTGYIIDGSIPQEWQGAQNIEFVYPGIYPWAEARIGVASVTGGKTDTTITMRQPVFDWATELYVGKNQGQTWSGLDWPGIVENSLTFLQEPGTFVVDRALANQHRLFYVPRNDEDMKTAEAIVPVLEQLVHAHGTPDSPLRGIAFRGLTFSYATWLQPGTNAGFLHFHGNMYHDGGPIHSVQYGEGAEAGTVTTPSNPATVPSNLLFEWADDIRFVDCRFTHLGATGVEFNNGCSNIILEGNEFDDISGGAMSMSQGASPSAPVRDGRIENNWIHDTGLEYKGTPGLYLNNTQSVKVTHNQINDVPYCGIVIYGNGPGRNNGITENLIFNSMKVLADGGGIYLSGKQGTSHEDGTVVRGNVIRDTLTPYNFGLYTDYGAAWITVSNNIVFRSDKPAVFGVVPPLEHVRFMNNFWDGDPAGMDTIPKSVVIKDNKRFKVTTFEEEIAKDKHASLIMKHAGLRSAHNSLGQY